MRSDFSKPTWFQDSPPPTQTFLLLLGSIAIAPMDCTDCSSKTGRYRVQPSSDFQTLPLAAPTKSVIFPEGSFVPAIAEIRPLIAADPILRAPKPEMVAEENVVSSARAEIIKEQKSAVVRQSFDMGVIIWKPSPENERSRRPPVHWLRLFR